MSKTHTIDPRTKRNMAVLILAQALLGSQMPMLFTIAGLAGVALSPIACLATLTISAIVGGSMLAATPLANIMDKRGRQFGFSIAAVSGAIGAGLGAAGIWFGAFWLMLLGGLFTGVYMSANGFYRFAALDTASNEAKPKVISLIMGGGLLAALIGPQLVKMTDGLIPSSNAQVSSFMGTYLVIVALNMIGPFLFAMLDIPKPEARSADAPKGRTRMELLATPRIAVSIICGMVSYGLMNLVMTATPLAVVGCGFEKADAANIVSLHVLAMFVPSFFTGHLIARFGVESIIAAGMVILAGAGIVALSGVDLGHFYIALILLGVGWNFGFIGATTMLSTSHAPHERGRIQGLNDLLVFGGVTLASLSSGGLMNCIGGAPEDGWSAVNIAMVPFLLLAGSSLIWLMTRPKDANPSA